MILIDANLLIYAATNCPEQDAARDWLDDQLNHAARVGLPWHSVLGFLRVTTNTRIYGTVVASVGEAWAQVEEWLSRENVWIPQPTSRHADYLRVALKDAGSGGELIPDAHLAALAMEHGLTLCSTDRDFARFNGLKWVNPLRVDKN